MMMRPETLKPRDSLRNYCSTDCSLVPYEELLRSKEEVSTNVERLTFEYKRLRREFECSARSRGVSSKEHDEARDHVQELSRMSILPTDSAYETVVESISEALMLERATKKAFENSVLAFEEAASAYITSEDRLEAAKIVLEAIDKELAVRDEIRIAREGQ